MTTPNNEYYITTLKDDIEADYMRGISQAIMDRLERFTDYEFSLIMDAVVECRLHIKSKKQRTRERNKQRAAIRESRIQATSMKGTYGCDVPSLYPDKALSEYGKRGAARAAERRKKGTKEIPLQSPVNCGTILS